MKQLFTLVQQRLQTIEGLRHIDKDWGQLQREQPPVRYPCALVDCEQKEFSQKGQHVVGVVAEVSVTIADMRMSNTGDTYAIFDLIDATHQALHAWSPAPGYGRLMASGMTKETADYGFEVYRLTFRTAFDIAMPDSRTQVTAQPAVVKG